MKIPRASSFFAPIGPLLGLAAILLFCQCSRPEAIRPGLDGGSIEPPGESSHSPGGGYRGPGDSVAYEIEHEVSRDDRSSGRGSDDDDERGRNPSPSPSTWRRSTAKANAVTLSVGDEDTLPLLGIEATVWVEGVRARVLVDSLFENDREEQLEGTFKLRLPEGAKPYYLAFGEEVQRKRTPSEAQQRDESLARSPLPESILHDREGHWKGARAARLVPRGQAARAYTNSVRRRADPALMEWAGAGIFQARVFPLAPHSTQRIVVGYEVDLSHLPQLPGDLVLDLDWPDEVPSLSLDIHVDAPAGSEVVVTPQAAPSSYGDRRSYFFPLTQARHFRVRTSGLAGSVLVSDEETGYFALDIDTAVLPGIESGAGGGASRAVFCIDTSLSSAESFETWLDLVQSILESNRDTLHEFAVLFFDVSPRWWRPSFSANTADAAAELRRFAEGLSLEGATDLGAALAEAARPTWLGLYDGPAWDCFLLSDGAATWGEADERVLAEEARGMAALFGYTTGKSGTNRSVLDRLARELGGAIFTLSGPADLPQAAVAHRVASLRIGGLNLPGCRDLLLRGRPTAFFPGQILRLVGRGMPRVGDVLEMTVDGPGGRRILPVKIDRILSTTLASRAYGEVATGQLEEFGHLTRGAAEAFATHFRVPGKAASLLMLESEEDYIRQGLLPQEQAQRARELEAAPLVAEALARLGRVLHDPAQALLERLEPVLASGEFLAEGTPSPEESGEDGEEGGVGDPPREPGWADGSHRSTSVLHLDPEFIAALGGLPRSSFAFETEPLRYGGLERQREPSAYTEALASGEPAYDQVQIEVARRLRELELGDAVRALSNLVELNPGDGVFMRDVAQTLTDFKLYGHAYGLYLRVAEARPFEPQSYLALARCAEGAGRADLALIWYTVALSGEWNPRFGDFERIAAFDALHFLGSPTARELRDPMAVWSTELGNRVSRTIGPDPIDLALAIEWNTDGTDIDLHIVEPTGEHCFYRHPDTAAGGHLSRDVTQGFGPELYLLPRAPSGTYTSYVHYFANNSSRTAVRTKVLATVWRNWGRPDETITRRVLRLDEAEEDQGIVRISIE